MTSIIKVDTIQNKAGSTSLAANKLPDMLSGSAKVWANLQSGTASILGSLNVSSTTDNGTGDHTITYNNALANDAYSVGGSAQTSRRYFSGNSAATKLASSMRIRIHVDNGTTNDADNSVQTFGDLA